jgi:uncharacterized protein (TIGR03437 family)
MRDSLILIVSFIAASSVHAATTLNLSHDLVPLGIASQNLTPNTPSLDAQPLFSAAVQYIQNNPVAVLTADPGAYYFLTSQNDVIYLFLADLSDLTIDFQGSTLYFKNGLLRSFEFDYCQRVTLKNFTIDSLAPRHTQVQLTAIDPVQGKLTYTVPPGWADPATFVDTVLGTPQLFAAFFRNGVQLPATALTFVTYPVTSPVLVVNSLGEPWTQPNILATLQPGDMAAVWDRSGLETILVDSGDTVTLSNIEIHGSGGGFAVQVSRSSNSIADNVRIKPRPGGLIASNADGIHFSFSIRNNHIRNCYVTGTTDDALAMDSDFIAAVVSQPGTRQLVATRNNANRVANGTMMNFVHLNNAAEVSGAIVVAQDPPDSRDVGSGDQKMTLTFDRDLPALAPGDEMVFASADMRGAGSTIEDNVVENIPYGRGMYLGGLENATIQRNVIRGTSNAGINVSEVTIPVGGGGLPSHGITIQDNSIESVLGPQASGAGGAYVNQAAIVVSSNDQNFDFVSQPVNSNISILNNYVADSGRGGIWIGEVNTGQVNGNVIVRWNRHPELPVWGDAPFPQDLTQPLVMRFNQNVNISNNVMQATSSLTGAANLSPPSASLRAESSAGSIAVQANVANFSWAAVSDSVWLTIAAGSSGTGNGTVQYAVAENTTGSPRGGTITIAGVVFNVQQSAVYSPPVFTAAGVGSAASYASGSVSPGEIAVIFGSNLGPSVLAGAALDNNGLVSKQIANTQVTFDGVAAPIVYVSANQTSVIVPYSVSGTSTRMVVTHNGQSSSPVTVGVASSVPGLFTADASGKGQGAFSSVDSRPNSAQNPAVKGSIVTLYATGEGQTSPPSVDGKIAVPPYTVPLLQVSVTIDGLPAEVDYKGGAPGEVAGVMQINVRIPAAAHSGNVPVVLTVGNAKSQDLVTVAVQ